VSGVYRVTVKLPEHKIGTVVVRADDRAQAKARALLQVRGMGHDVADGDVMLCRKDNTTSTAIGNRPTSPIGGKPA